jgi:regulator of extracellular matrix RemA (YlzA/DUF370 family)
LKSQKLNLKLNLIQSLLIGSGLVFGAQAFGAMTTDGHGNVGYDTAAECDAAVLSGKAKMYRSFTTHPALKRAGEMSFKVMPLSDLSTANYTNGACDIGVGPSQGRDGVSTVLHGKFVPYSPTMPVNVYYDNDGKVMRASMKQCDNNFQGNLPRPVAVSAPVIPAAVLNSDCFASVAVAPKYETRSEQVVKVAATKRYEVIPATFKTIEEKVLVSPEYRRQIPVPATYKTVAEEVEARPASFREEPIPATYKVVQDRVMVRPETKRFEIVPETYKSVTEQVMVTPARREIKVTPAVYGDKEINVADRPTTTRIEAIPATFKMITEQIVGRPESVSYEPIALPLRTVTNKAVLSEASTRLEASDASYRTVTERVLVKDATTRLVEVPATYETVTERVKVADASTEWKRGSAWLSRAITTRSASSFKVGADGRVDGSRVDPKALAGNSANANRGGSNNAVAGAAFGTGSAAGVGSAAEDDLMCLVEIPERFETITRQVVKTPAAVRQEVTPAVYTTVTRQVVDREAATRKVDIPASYQTVTYQEIDTDKLRSMGYKFDASGNITNTPAGDRVLRANQIPGASGSTASGAGAGMGGNTSLSDAGASVGSGVSGGARSGLEAYVREIRVPAEMRTVTRQVIDQPATVRTVEVAGTMQKVKSRALISEAKSEEIVIPATYQTITRQVIDQPATTREVVVPAEYKTVERRAVDVAASMRQVPVQAVMQNVTRRVVDAPASVRDEIVPAVYKTETRQVVDRPATTREIDVPAQYETLTNQVVVAEANRERRAILCETNATAAKITEIQRALLKAGFNPGRQDGVINAELMSAVNRYQSANKLPVDIGGRYLNIETVKSLGVSPH